jgi:acetylornithine deacetylase/succinyl-diaminopimelate desuccinylase-like protein
MTHWDTVAHDLFKELVEINTTQSVGSTAQAARAMAARLRAAGFADSDVVVLEDAPRKGNLVARLRAKKPVRKPILLLSHIDVVEANAADWTLPPFTFTEKDGTFFGRGTSDNKDDAAIHLALIMRLKAENYVLDRDIIVALTTDEEGGPDNGVSWIVKNRPELIKAEFAFNEGGNGRVRDGKKLSHDIQEAEKKYVDFQLETTNPGGHSSRPVKENAIYELAAALSKVAAYDFPVHLNDVTREYFKRSAPIVDPKIGWAMTAIADNPKDVAAANALSADPSYNSQLRTTCVATMLEGGHAPNALPQRARANVNCRILPNEDPKDIQRQLAQVINNPKVMITQKDTARPSAPSVMPYELTREIERVTDQLWPGLAVIPTMSTGATDGLRLRNAGIPTYGVAGQFYGDSNAHGMNERIPQQAFYDSLEFMTRLVKNLSRPVVN